MLAADDETVLDEALGAVIKQAFAQITSKTGHVPRQIESLDAQQMALFDFFLAPGASFQCIIILCEHTINWILYATV